MCYDRTEMANNQLDYHEKQQQFINSQRKDMYLKDGDTLSLTIQSIDGIVDLGEQTKQKRPLI